MAEKDEPKAYYDIDSRPDVRDWCCTRGDAKGLSRKDTLFLLTLFPAVDAFDRCLALLGEGQTLDDAIDQVKVEERLG